MYAERYRGISEVCRKYPSRGDLWSTLATNNLLVLDVFEWGSNKFVLALVNEHGAQGLDPANPRLLLYEQFVELTRSCTCEPNNKLLISTVESLYGHMLDLAFELASYYLKKGLSSA